MKTMNMWRLCLAMLAAFSLASCSSDDDEVKPSKSDIQRVLFEMKNTYTGTLFYGLKDKSDQQKISGYAASSAEGLTIKLPLEPIAEQVVDETLAQKIRELGYVEVYATYQFEKAEQNGNAQFVLLPKMERDERISTPLTRTDVTYYSGLKLFFANTYTGYFVKENQALGFNICVNQVLIDNKPLEGFQPVIYRYEGTVGSGGTEQPAPETEVEREHRQQTDAALQGIWFLDDEEILAENLIGEGKTHYERGVSGYVYNFTNGHFTISYFETSADKNKYVANGTYTIRYDEKTNDTVLLLNTYATDDVGQQLFGRFTIYNLSHSELEFREQRAKCEVIYRLSRYGDD